jgi:hypothetical protein
VKLGSSDDDTAIATTMGEVEAMMDPEEKSTIIQIFKRHNNQHVWLRVLIYKEIKMESSSMIWRVWLV